jgi:hypothetical protein
MGDQPIPQMSPVEAALAAQLKDLLLRVYAIQSLLDERGIISAIDVEKRLAEFQVKWFAHVGKSLLEAMEKHREEQLRLLLEKHEGTKQ